MIVVDFTKHSGKMNESILRALGSWSKSILKHMYGKDVSMVADLNKISLSSLISEEGEPNFVIRGRYRDVKAYATALVREKDYLDKYIEFGKDHPQTEKARANLLPAVREFESATGLPWPFKDEG